MTAQCDKHQFPSVTYSPGFTIFFLSTLYSGKYLETFGASDGDSVLGTVLDHGLDVRRTVVRIPAETRSVDRLWGLLGILSKGPARNFLRVKPPGRHLNHSTPGCNCRKLHHHSLAQGQLQLHRTCALDSVCASNKRTMFGTAFIGCSCLISNSVNN